MYKIGKYGALKPCHWFWEKLKTGYRNCYKGVYGIESECCIQCTPNFPFCNHSCVFCWRDIDKDLNIEMNEYDDPKELVDSFIEKQKEIVNSLNINNYLKNVEIAEKIYEKYKGKEIEYSNVKEIVSKKKFLLIMSLLKACKKVSKYEIPETFDSEKIKKLIKHSFENAKKPKHVAISLDGEPTLYPKLGKMILEFRKRGFTTFVVTNGTKPEIIKKLWEKNQLPTQLYVTLAAPNKEIYRKVCRPKILNGWEKLMETLSLLNELPCRTVIRITSVKNLNMCNVKEYEKIIDNSKPWFVEIKGFTAESHAKEINKRIGKEDFDPVPTYEDILNFAKEFKYKLIYTNKDSRFALLEVNPKGELKIKENEI